jgi:hypothetical protein
MNSPNAPALTDGIIFLRPLTPEDAADHLAGEDEEMVKWVSGGRSTLATVEAFFQNNQRVGEVAVPAAPLAYSIVRAIDWSASLK